MKAWNLRFLVSAACSVAFAALGILAVWRGVAWCDAIWQVSVAGWMLDGARLYTDIIEINPPLIYWITMPVVAAARAAGVDPVLAYDGVVVVLAVASLGCTAGLLARVEQEWRTWLVPILTFALLLVPGRSMFAEREHLVAILLLPWVALGAVRSFTAVGRGEAIGIGVAAGLAVALKPHYALVLFGIAAYGLRRENSWRAVRRPEYGAVVLTLLSYGALTVALTPSFYAVARRLGPLYLVFHHRSAVEILADGTSWMALGTLLLYLGLRRLRRVPAKGATQAWLDVLAIFVAGALVGVLAQSKGLWYHYLPAATGTVLLTGSLTALYRGKLRLAPAAVTCALALMALALRIREAAGARDPGEIRYQELAAALDRGGRPSSLLALDPSGSQDPIRYMYYAGVRWASRWPFIWPLWSLTHVSGVREAPGNSSLGGARWGALENWFEDVTVTDAAERRPELVLLKTPYLSGDRRIDTFGYLARDPRFRDFLKGYDEEPTVGIFRIYRRRHRPT